MSFYAPHVTPFAHTVTRSHAGMLTQHGLCLCDEDHAAFDDCFGFWVEEVGVTDPSLLEVLRGLSHGWSGTFDELLEAGQALQH
jgi:hypothetical protein